MPIPPRPLCRPAPARSATLCFWTVLLLFLGLIGYLGLLAFTRNAGQSQPYHSSGGHLFLAVLLVGFGIAAVIGVIATRFKRLH